MKKFNITCVIGTRPEALKMFPIIKALQADKLFSVCTIITGQHRELLAQLLKSLAINVTINFDLMKSNQSLTALSAKLLQYFEAYFSKQPCDLLIAQGDTTTVLMAALSAFYKKIPFAHVEAGLRTKNISDPFPEEFNRRAITLAATLHFCPTQSSANNLLKEGIQKNVFVTGNTIIDTLYAYLKKNSDDEKKSDKKLILVTCHRRENFGKPLLHICKALKKLAERNPEIELLFPVHPNPNIKKVVEKQLSNIHNIKLSEPLDYEALVPVLQKAYLVLTDSGGLQEEAPALNKPVLVLRNETERPEGVACCAALLVGHDTNTIVQQVEKLLTDVTAYESMSRAVSPYGDGQAAERIVHLITQFFL